MKSKTALVIGATAYLYLPLFVNPCNQSIEQISSNGVANDYRCLVKAELPGGFLSIGTSGTVSSSGTVSEYYSNYSVLYTRNSRNELC